MAKERKEQAGVMLGVRLPADLKTALEDAAERRGLTVTAVLTRLIKDDLWAHDEVVPAEASAARQAAYAALSAGESPVVAVLTAHQAGGWRSPLQLLLRLTLASLDYQALLDEYARQAGRLAGERRAGSRAEKIWAEVLAPEPEHVKEAAGVLSELSRTLRARMRVEKPGDEYGPVTVYWAFEEGLANAVTANAGATASAVGRLLRLGYLVPAGDGAGPLEYRWVPSC